MRTFVSVGFASVLVGALGAAACGGDDSSVGGESDASADGAVTQDASADTSSHVDAGRDSTSPTDANPGGDDAADTASPIDASDAGTADADDGSSTQDASDGSSTADANDGSSTADANDGSSTADANDGSSTADASDAAASGDGGHDGGADASDAGGSTKDAGLDSGVDATDADTKECADSGPNEVSCANLDFTGQNFATYDPVTKIFTFHPTSGPTIVGADLSVTYSDQFGYSDQSVFGACQVVANTITCDLSAKITHEVLALTLVELFLVDECGQQDTIVVHVRPQPGVDAGSSKAPWEGSCQ